MAKFPFSSFFRKERRPSERSKASSSLFSNVALKDVDPEAGKTSAESEDAATAELRSRAEAGGVYNLPDPPGTASGDSAPWQDSGAPGLGGGRPQAQGLPEDQEPGVNRHGVLPEGMPFYRPTEYQESSSRGYDYNQPVRGSQNYARPSQASLNDDEEEPIYYAPGEPLSGRPGEAMRRRRAEEQARRESEQAAEQARAEAMRQAQEEIWRSQQAEAQRQRLAAAELEAEERSRQAAAAAQIRSEQETRSTSSTEHEERLKEAEEAQHLASAVAAHRASLSEQAHEARNEPASEQSASANIWQKTVADLQKDGIAEQDRRSVQAEEAQRRAEAEEAQRRAEAEEAQRRTEAEEAQRRAEAEEAQRRAAAEAQRRAEAEEAQRRAEAEKAQRRAEAEEAQRRAEAEAAQNPAAQAVPPEVQAPDGAAAGQSAFLAVPGAASGAVSEVETPSASARAEQRRDTDASSVVGTHRSKVDAESRIGIMASIFLYFRQLIGSFFTHTTLNLLMPRISLKCGPCYPSSMPLPYFVTGALCALPAVYLPDYGRGIDTGVLALALLVAVTGLNGFRGLGRIFIAFSQRSIDGYIKIVSAFIFSALFVCFYDACEDSFLPDIRYALVIGAIMMLSACVATSISFGCAQDPVNSFGTLSPFGLFFSVLVTLLVVYAVFSPMLATSLAGIALLARTLCGIFFSRHNLRASRTNVCGVMYLTLLLLLADLFFMGNKLAVLNPQVFGI